MKPKVKRVAFTMVPVESVEKARVFYEETLGLVPGYEVPGSWIEYDRGGTCFGIYKFKLPWVTPGHRIGNLALEVASLAETLSELKNAGVPLEMDLTVTPVCKMAAVKDLDGNVIMLHELHP
jgi:catechol 2,3-dioxygenase-like lactoylglutathione lyase family enzyme